MCFFSFIIIIINWFAKPVQVKAFGPEIRTKAANLDSRKFFEQRSRVYFQATLIRIDEQRLTSSFWATPHNNKRIQK